MIGVCGIGVNWINRLFKVKGFLQLERSPFRLLMQFLVPSGPKFAGQSCCRLDGLGMVLEQMETLGAKENWDFWG